MLDSTFFKFLLAFIGIIGISFLIMGVAGGFSDNIAKTPGVEKATFK